MLIDCYTRAGNEKAKKWLRVFQSPVLLTSHQFIKVNNFYVVVWDFARIPKPPFKVKSEELWINLRNLKPQRLTMNWVNAYMWCVRLETRHKLVKNLFYSRIQIFFFVACVIVIKPYDFNFRKWYERFLSWSFWGFFGMKIGIYNLKWNLLCI